MSREEPSGPVVSEFDTNATIPLGADNPDTKTLEMDGWSNTGEGVESFEAGIINVVNRHHLPDLIRRYRLTRVESLPESFREIDEYAAEGETPDRYFDFWQTGDYAFPLPTERLKAAIRAVRDGQGFNADRFRLHHPQQPAGGEGERSAVIILTDNTPDAWITDQVFDGRDDFAEFVGERACHHHDPAEQFDEPIYECPVCHRIPDAVRESLDNLTAEHPGVAVIIGVRALRVTPERSKDRSEDIEEAIERYMEATGDDLLADEGKLREFLAERNVGARS